MTPCKFGRCDGSGETKRPRGDCVLFGFYVDICECAKRDTIPTAPDPWAILALRQAEHEAAEAAYEVAFARRKETWVARRDAAHAADASGIPRPT